MSGNPPKSYDRAYFDKWYRSEGSRVTNRAEVERKVRMVVGVAEYLLGRAIRSVLDVGCGEGVWQPILQRLRPGSRYAGVDASEYAVRRFGARRNVRLGTFGELDTLGLDDYYDLIVACDVLHYLPMPELRRGLAVIGEHLGGVAYLEAYTKSDAISGDMVGFARRAPGTYRRLFNEAGLAPVGLHCYVNRDTGPDLTALERPASVMRPPQR